MLVGMEMVQRRWREAPFSKCSAEFLSDPAICPQKNENVRPDEARTFTAAPAVITERGR